jgi:hypothetical protein
MGLAARLLLLCRVEGQVCHTAEIEEYVLLSINAPEHYMPAKGTPVQPGRGTAHIDALRQSAPLRRNLRLAFRACDIHREYSTQFTRGCISVKVVHRCTHFH